MALLSTPMKKHCRHPHGGFLWQRDGGCGVKQKPGEVYGVAVLYGLKGILGTDGIPDRHPVIMRNAQKLEEHITALENAGIACPTGGVAG